MSVAALVVPQSMSYARLAGLPSVIGLYGAFVPVLCYAALGSSRHLARAPRPALHAPCALPCTREGPTLRFRAAPALTVACIHAGVERAAILSAPAVMLRETSKGVVAGESISPYAAMHAGTFAV